MFNCMMILSMALSVFSGAVSPGDFSMNIFGTMFLLLGFLGRFMGYGK